MTIADQLASIVPGLNYPKTVSITDSINPDKKFKLTLVQSSQKIVISTHIDNVWQGTGSFNPQVGVDGIKRKIMESMARGALIEIGEIVALKK